MVRECMSAVILCGGRSSRMDGFPKQFLLYQGRTFQDKLLDELEGFGEVALSDNREDAGNGRIVWRDIVPGCGPLSGIHAALSYAAYDWVFVTACDMPRLSGACVDFLIGCVTDACDCVVPYADGKVHPLCAIYHKSALPQAEALLAEDDYRVRSLLDRIRTVYVEMPDSCLDCFYNVNTPELFRRL